MTLPRPRGAAHRRLGATPLQFLHQGAHLRRVGAEFEALGVNRRVENRHGFLRLRETAVNKATNANRRVRAPRAKRPPLVPPAPHLPAPTSTPQARRSPP